MIEVDGDHRTMSYRPVFLRPYRTLICAIEYFPVEVQYSKQILPARTIYTEHTNFAHRRIPLQLYFPL